MEKKETNYVVRKIYYISAPDPDDAILQAKERLPDLVKCAEYRRRRSEAKKNSFTGNTSWEKS